MDIKWSDLKRVLGDANLTISVDFGDGIDYDHRECTPKKLNDLIVIDVLHTFRGIHINLISQ